MSRTLDLLDREGLVTRGERGDVGALDWERAIRRWSEDYDFGRSNRVTAYVHSGGTVAMVEKIARAALPYALTGAVASQILIGRPGAPLATARLAAYVEDVDLAAGRLGLGTAEKAPAENEATIVLAEAYDRVVFERTLMRNGIRVAAPSQLAADLLGGNDPARSQAEGVVAWMRSHDPSWRHVRSEPNLVLAQR